MPAKRRIKPVIEEIVETPQKSVETVSHSHPHEHHEAKKHEVFVEEEPKPEETFRETAHKVATYDEPEVSEPQSPIPPPIEHPKDVLHERNVESVARELLGEFEEKKGKKINFKLIFVVTVVTALVVGFVAGGIYVYMSGSEVAPENTTPQETPVPQVSIEPKPTQSPKPAIKLNDLSVNVLNGSGIIGAAGKVKDALEAHGFKVSGTGNAQRYNFQKTVVQLKKGTSAEVYESLKKALSEYSIELGAELPETSVYDVVVTAGKE